MLEAFPPRFISVSSILCSISLVSNILVSDSSIFVVLFLVNFNELTSKYQLDFVFSTICRCKYI